MLVIKNKMMSQELIEIFVIQKHALMILDPLDKFYKRNGVLQSNHYSDKKYTLLIMTC